MSKFKYINFENLGMVIFENQINHAEMASWLNDTPISAGFVSLPNKDENGNIAHCYGESISLRLESRKEDTELLQRSFNPYS
ncbi:MAG: hypothetical protein JHC33_02455 [Ignisphaera sp.]|nr:hypothetical protein [Ignisphaera sp.]